MTQREKNLLSLCIILGGMFVGSLFVDLWQMASGSGFSARAVREHNLLEAGGKTWVAYTEPLVDVMVITDTTCMACNPSEALVWLRRIVPTMQVREIASDSEVGQVFIRQHALVTLPAFLFSPSIEQTAFYAQAGTLFQKREGAYVLDMSAIGLKPGKYLVLPDAAYSRLYSEAGDSPLRMTIYTDFACVHCREYHTVLQKLIAGEGWNISLRYQLLPDFRHPPSLEAATAALCAAEQNTFTAYADLLFQKQSEWKRSNAATPFMRYARTLGIDGRQFSLCLDDTVRHQKYFEAVEKEAARYTLTGTPATFIGDRLVQGALSDETLKEEIETR